MASLLQRKFVVTVFFLLREEKKYEKISYFNCFSIFSHKRKMLFFWKKSMHENCQNVRRIKEIWRSLSSIFDATNEGKKFVVLKFFFCFFFIKKLLFNLAIKTIRAFVKFYTYLHKKNLRLFRTILVAILRTH